MYGDLNGEFVCGYWGFKGYGQQKVGGTEQTTCITGYRRVG